MDGGGRKEKGIYRDAPPSPPHVGLRSSNHNIRAAAERMAMNAPIQGTAADVMKLAMVRTEKPLEGGLIGSDTTSGA